MIDIAITPTLAGYLRHTWLAGVLHVLLSTETCLYSTQPMYSARGWFLGKKRKTVAMLTVRSRGRSHADCALPWEKPSERSSNAQPMHIACICFLKEKHKQ
jgi:hypothetical protein